MGKVITYEEALWNRYKKLRQERGELWERYNALKAEKKALESEKKALEARKAEATRLRVIKK